MLRGLQANPYVVSHCVMHITNRLRGAVHSGQIKPRCAMCGNDCTGLQHIAAQRWRLVFSSARSSGSSSALTTALLPHDPRDAGEAASSSSGRGVKSAQASSDHVDALSSSPAGSGLMQAISMKPSGTCAWRHAVAAGCELCSLLRQPRGSWGSDAVVRALLLPEQRAGADGEAFDKDAAVRMSTQVVVAVPLPDLSTSGVGAAAECTPLPLLLEAASPASRGSWRSDAVVRALLLPEERAELQSSRQCCGYNLTDVTAGQVSCPGHLHPA